MGKAIQYLLILAKFVNGSPIVLLIKEKACLLTVLHIHHIPDTILHNLHLGVKRLSYKALAALHALL